MFLGVNYYGKPTLAMDDETGTRVALGSGYTETGGDSNSWSLSFSPVQVGMGMYAEKTRGHTFVRGFLQINKEKVEYPNKPPK